MKIEPIDLDILYSGERNGFPIYSRKVCTDVGWTPLNDWIQDNLKLSDYRLMEKCDSNYTYSLALIFEREEDYHLFLLTFKHEYVHHYQL